MKTTRNRDSSPTPYTAPTDVQGVLDEFEWLGIARKTGEFRKGRPVYTLIEFGRKLGDENPGEKFSAAVEALARRKLA
jgi:hypothetical protein